MNHLAIIRHAGGTIERRLVNTAEPDVGDADLLDCFPLLDQFPSVFALLAGANAMLEGDPASQSILPVAVPLVADLLGVDLDQITVEA